MACVLCDAAHWLASKLSPVAAERDRAVGERLLDWDYQQANDFEIWDRDPKKELMQEGYALRRTDPAAAFGLMLELAEQGSVWSMLYVADSYADGNGVDQDPARVEDWYRLAYEGGSERALLKYCRICGLRCDLAKCEEILCAAAERGWAPAMYWLARYSLRRNPTRKTLLQVRPLLEQASEKGSLLAGKFLARKMLFGKFGVREIPHGYRLTIDSFTKLDAVWSELEEEAVRKS